MKRVAGRAGQFSRDVDPMNVQQNTGDLSTVRGFGIAPQWLYVNFTDCVNNKQRDGSIDRKNLCVSERERHFRQESLKVVTESQTNASQIRESGHSSTKTNLQVDRTLIDCGVDLLRCCF